MMKYPNFSPSAIFLISFGIALLLSWTHPWHVSLFMNDETMRLSGLVILLISFILNTFAYKEFKKSLTPHAPFSTPTVLIHNGIFSFSRNPVYLALVLSQCGLGFVFDSVWLIIASIVLLTVLHYVIIADEEKVLGDTFKERYTDYKKRTRRWL